MQPSSPTPEEKRGAETRLPADVLKKTLKIIFWSLLSIILLSVVALSLFTWYLTPDRLTSILNREMSEYFNADVEVKDARFTFWSTFPRFMIETDSVTIVSRTLDGQPKKVMDALPADARFLASADRFSGGINIVKLLGGRYELRNIDIDGLRLNMVSYNDSVNNYDILPKDDEDNKQVPFFTCNLINVTNPKGLKAYFAATDTKAEVELDSAVMRRLHSDKDYDLAIRGKVTAETSNFRILDSFPFGLEGNVALNFKPFGLKFSDFDVDLGSIRGRLNMSMDLEGDMKINNFDYDLSVLNLMKLLRSFPGLDFSDLSSIQTDLDISATARLTAPYKFSSVELPSLELDFNVPAGRIDYDFKNGKDYGFEHNAFTGRLMFDGKNPKKSYFDFTPLQFSCEGISCVLEGKISNLLDRPLVETQITGMADLANAYNYLSALSVYDLDGKINLEGNMSFCLESLSSEGIEQGLHDFRFDVNAEAADLSGKFSELDFRIGSGKLVLHSEGVDPDPQRPFDLPVVVTVDAENISLSHPASDLQCNIGSVEGATSITSLDNINAFAPQLDVSLSGIDAEMGGTDLKCSQLDISTTLPPLESNLIIPDGLTFKGNDFTMGNAGINHTAVKGFSGKITGLRGGGNSHLDFSSSSLSSVAKGLYKIDATDLDASVSMAFSPSVEVKGGSLKASKFSFVGNQGDKVMATTLACNAVLASGSSGILLKEGKLSAADLLYSEPGGSVVKATKFACTASGVTEKIKTSMGASSLDMKFPEASLKLQDVDVALDYVSGIKSFKTGGETLRDILTSQPDASTLERAPHSDPFIMASLPEKARRFINSHDVALKFKSKGGRFDTPSFSGDNVLSDIDLSLDMNSLVINHLGVRSHSTGATLSGSATNLREFLTSKTPVPLKMKFDVALDTVNINELARSYVDGQKKQGHPMEMADRSIASPEDSVAVLIPRNLEAEFHVSARESVYMSLHLYDLFGTVRVKDGIATVDNFNISADFGHADLGLVYDTSDMQKMGVQAKMDLEDIDVVSFFRHFHTLLLMMPEMENLKGNVSLDLDGSLDLFPDMCVNMPSLDATVGLKGWNLTVRQNKFIHRLARKLLIRKEGDLKIADVNVTAHVRDNLLELYPFDFEVEKYLLHVLGTNNFNGDLYYHIDVKKSPLPFPFGVNIEGKFADPRIRFGLPGYERKKAQEITSDVMISDNMNLVREVKYYVKEFIRKAAESASPKNI